MQVLEEANENGWALQLIFHDLYHLVINKYIEGGKTRKKEFYFPSRDKQTNDKAIFIVLNEIPR